MKRGGYGLKRDIILGLVGSVGANVILRTLGVLTGAGIFVVAVVALIGAAIPIVAQRKFWPTESAGEEKRSEERRVGKECRAGWWSDERHEKEREGDVDER